VHTAKEINSVTYLLHVNVTFLVFPVSVSVTLNDPNPGFQGHGNCPPVTAPADAQSNGDSWAFCYCIVIVSSIILRVRISSVTV